MDLGELPRRNARRYPDEPCLAEGKKRYSFRDYDHRVNRLANGLLQLGVGRGDRVAVLLTNCSEYVEIYFGLAKMGAIAVPLNTRLHAQEYIRYFKVTSPTALLVGEPFQHVVSEIRPALDTVRHVAWVGENPCDGAVPYEAVLSGSPPTEPLVEVSENDVATIFFTSGTTGLPKGAMWTHRNVLEQMVNLQMGLPFSREDRGLIVLPMFHGPVTIPILHQLMYVGGSMVVSPHAHFDAGQFLGTIGQEKITCTFVVPTMLVQLVNHLEIDRHRETLKHLRQIKYAASPASARVLKRAIELFGPILTQGYGLTETVGGVSFLSKQDHAESEGRESKLTSCGKEYINVHIRIVDENGREVPPGTVGEILVKGDKNFVGYWDMPEETEKVLKGGWLHTSDLGMFDEERYLYLVDRKKDMIISGGENIYPAEIEGVINRHAKVKECAVIGVPDPLWGESVKAFVVLEDGESATAEEIVGICLENLASYKKPKFVEFVDGLPKNSMGKILKHLLREKVSQEGGENATSGS
ncbi:MAG: long-chain-fatty-acid--CoA ligase [Deltaproteobacteria bacterium]|nr:long-chain-fatty-acid--CoA ligase [Deltaproteobacteria bacterium]